MKVTGNKQTTEVSVSYFVATVRARCCCWSVLAVGLSLVVNSVSC